MAELKDLQEINGRKIHELKILPEYYNAVRCGDKRFEIRKNDRGFHRGDILRLKEWDGEKERVVFMKMRDRFGKNCIKFVGVFKADSVDSDGGRHYKRKSTCVKIEDLKSSK